jgi:hypothetical protein
MSDRSLRCGTSELFTTSTPPGLTAGSKASIEGMLSTMAALGRRTSGEPISAPETMTVQRAFPPRISGP